jgi:hypothetical protein
MKIDSFKILDSNGWNLMEELPQNDYDYPVDYPKIPLNFLCDVKTKHGKYYYTTKHYQKPEVTLEITTWRGISIGAIHYYGKLNISLPEMTRDDKEHWTISCFSIPAFHNDAIKLTSILEQWEIDKYPENYPKDYGFKAGQFHTGFSGPESVITAGKELFKRLFEKGWVFKIDKIF